MQSLSTTDYGKRFGVQREWGYESFARQVPTATYQDLQPFMEYECGLLSSQVKVWEPTGGSTGGSKWIPWTVGLQAEFRRAVQVWIFELFRSRPGLKLGRGYWQLTPKTSLSPPEWLVGQRTGFESDGDYLGRFGRLVENWVTVQIPAESQDLWERTTTVLRGARDLTLLSCWSPSFLQVLQHKMQERYGCWNPRDWWPELQLISCWTQGPSASLLPQVEEMFPGVEIQGKGLLATEAVTTVPVGQLYPLAYRSHFFEFQAEDATVYPSWDLRAGSRYQVIQTTGAGLIRYRSEDWVRVTDFFGEVPCLEFLGRARVCDRFGEKLNETFLQDRLSELQRFAVLGFEDNGYVLFLDTRESALECRERLNRSLLEVFTYRDCLELGQLRELRLFVLEDNGWEQLSLHLDQQQGRRKPSALLPDGVWSKRFKGEFWDL